MVEIHDVDENAPWRNDPDAKAAVMAAREWNIHHRKGNEAFAEQIKVAINLWKDGSNSEQNGRIKKQLAVLEIGATLIAGRKSHLSDKQFGEWVKTLKFESPFNDRRERSAAIQLAQLFEFGIRPVSDIFTDGSTPVSGSILPCPHTRPIDILKWARKTGLILPKPRNPEAVRQAREKIRVVVENGQPVKRDEISEATGLSDGAVGRAHAMEQARLEGIAEGEANILNAQSKFTKVQAKHLTAFTNKLERHLRQTFETAVEARVEERVKQRKAALDAAREACNKQRNEAFKKEQLWHNLINNRKPIFTIEQFKMIVMALHPDNSASGEIRARAFQDFNDKKLQLTSKP